MLEYKIGKLPSQILVEMGFYHKIPGQSRIDNITRRNCWKKQKSEIEFLKTKVEFLSDLKRLEMEVMWKVSKSKKKKSSKWYIN